MQKLKTKIRQLKYRFKYDFFTFDNIILIVASVCCLIWTYEAINSMSRNWQLAETIASRKRELALLSLEVETMELENNYYNSAEYQELVARRVQNKKFSGENLVYLPPNSENAKNKHKDTITQTTEDDRTNFQKWLQFLFD